MGLAFTPGRHANAFATVSRVISPDPFSPPGVIQELVRKGISSCSSSFVSSRLLNAPLADFIWAARFLLPYRKAMLIYLLLISPSKLLFDSITSSRANPISKFFVFASSYQCGSFLWIFSFYTLCYGIWGWVPSV